MRLPLVLNPLEIESEVAKAWIGRSWLCSSSDGFGCLVCHEHCLGKTNPFATCSITQLRGVGRGFAIFRKHHESKMHRESVRSFLKVSLGPRGDPIAGAPMPEEFKRVWDAFKDGSVGQGVSGIGAQKKCMKIAQCLFEAMLCLERQMVRASKSIGIQRDEAHGRLWLCHRICSDDFRETAGILGMVSGFGTGAKNIVKATEQAFRVFCTPGAIFRSDAPLSHHRGAMDTDLFQILTQRVEMINVDSASDELLASRMMKDTTSAMLTDMGPLTPNLKIIIRDATHATRRVIEKPWGGDAFFSDLMQKLITSPHSIIQRVENSWDFKEKFAHFVKQTESELGAEIKNMRASRHRFERAAMPTGRFVLWFDAILATANYMVAQRGSRPEGKDAREFLDYIDERKVVAMAMLADAAHEGLALTRFADQADADVGEAPFVCANFLRRMQVLFVAGQCTTLPGFTEFALRRLQTPRVVYQPCNKMKSIGGPGKVPDHMVHDLLQKMACFVRLVVSVVATEFPSWNVLQAFIIFHLAEKTRVASQGSYMLEDGTSAFAKLAHFFGLDVEELQLQHAEFLPLARHFYSTLCCTNVEAWRRSLLARRSRSCTNKNHPSDALAFVFERYVVFSSTTAGVERVNATADRVLRFRGGALFSRNSEAIGSQSQSFFAS